jgi:ankyrin repeat protein
MRLGDNERWVPLHFASQHGHLHMERLLLDRGADANIQHNGLRSPQR